MLSKNETRFAECKPRFCFVQASRCAMIDAAFLRRHELRLY